MMSGSLYGLTGMGSNGLGMMNQSMGGAGGSVSPSLLAMLMSRLGGSAGTGSNAPTMPSAPQHIANMPNPQIQAAPVVQQAQQNSTGLGSILGGGGSGLSSLLSALGGGQTGLTQAGQGVASNLAGTDTYTPGTNTINSGISPDVTAALNRAANSVGNYQNTQNLTGPFAGLSRALQGNTGGVGSTSFPIAQNPAYTATTLSPDFLQRLLSVFRGGTS